MANWRAAPGADGASSGAAWGDRRSAVLASRSVAFDLDDLPRGVTDFLTERHLASLTVVRDDGSPQVTPVGVTWDGATGTARVITWDASIKARLVARSPGTPVAVCQVDGGRWLTLYGRATVTDEPGAVAEAVTRYAERYRQPKQRPDRVVIEIDVDRIVGRAPDPEEQA